MQGRRRPDNALESGDGIEPGDYWRRGTPTHGWEWWVRDPYGDYGHLTAHLVTENADGTITVEPSILSGGPHKFHGWLRAGVWSFADDSGHPGKVY
jgi:hypothetical protein